MELAEDARRGRAALPGWSSGCWCAREARLGLERARSSASTTPLTCRKPPSAIPATRSRSSGRSPAGQVDAGDLEQRDPARAGVEVALRRLDRGSGAGDVRERAQLDRDRLGQLPARVVVGPQARGVDLREAEADERVLDAAAQLLLAGEQRPYISRRAGSVNGTSSSRKRAISSITSTSRGDVAGAPGRDDDARRPGGRSRGARGSRTGARAASRRRSARRPARAGRRPTGRSGSVLVHVARRRPAARR